MVWQGRRRFYPLVGVLLLLVGAQASNGRWFGDFWEHAAVVRALAAHPLHPHHSLLAVEAPHALFSPYALVLGLIARLTGASPVTLLTLTGIANLALFCVALRVLVVRLFDEHAPFLVAPVPAAPVGTRRLALERVRALQRAGLGRTLPLVGYWAGVRSSPE